MSKQIPFLRELIDYGTIFFQQATDRSIELIIARMPKDGTLRLLGALAALTHKNPLGQRAFQIGIVREFGDGLPYAKRIENMLVSNPVSILIYEEQIAVLCKFISLYATGATWQSDFGDSFLRLLLLYNSQRGKATGIAPSPASKAYFAKVELLSMCGHNDELQLLTIRYAEFFAWAKRAPALLSENFIDIDDKLLEFYGLTYLEYASIGFAVLGQFSLINTVADLSKFEVIPDISTLFNGLEKKEAADNWVKDHQIPIDEFIDSGKREAPISYTGVSLIDNIKRPLLRLADGRSVCPSIELLEDAALGSGIYFALLDGLNVYEGRAASNRLTRFFGEFFEDYIVSLFMNSYKVNGARLFPEFEYAAGKKSTDLIIIEGDRALFLDVTSSRFTLRTSLAQLDDIAISKDIGKIFSSNARQMTTCIEAFRDGSLHLDGVDPKAINKIFPAVIVPQTIPRLVGINELIDTELRQNALLPNCYPMEILTAQECERFEGTFVREQRLSEVFLRKSRHPIGAGMSMKNYIHAFEPALLQTRLANRLRNEYVVWFETVISLFGRWGLPVDLDWLHAFVEQQKAN